VALGERFGRPGQDTEAGEGQEDGSFVVRCVLYPLPPGVRSTYATSATTLSWWFRWWFIYMFN
jgi:hypothetical protein